MALLPLTATARRDVGLAGGTVKPTPRSRKQHSRHPPRGRGDHTLLASRLSQPRGAQSGRRDDGIASVGMAISQKGLALVPIGTLRSCIWYRVVPAENQPATRRGRTRQCPTPALFSRTRRGGSWPCWCCWSFLACRRCGLARSLYGVCSPFQRCSSC